MFFATEASSLPHPRKANDIIRVHRARVSHWRERPQAVATLKARGKSSFILFDTHDDTVNPYQQSSAHFSLGSQDNYHLEQIRSFACREAPTGPQQYVAPISDLAPSPPTDVVCHVLYSEPISGTDSIAIFIWDGTDAPVPIGETWSESSTPPIRPRLDKAGASFSGDGSGFAPAIGSIVPVIANEHHSHMNPPPEPSSWVKLKHLVPSRSGRQLHLQFVEQSKVEPNVSPGLLLDRYNERLQNRETVPRPADGRLIVRTENFHRENPLSTLREALMHEPPSKFRVLARIRRWFPSNPGFAVAVSSGGTHPELRLGAELEVLFFCCCCCCCCCCLVLLVLFSPPSFGLGRGEVTQQVAWRMRSSRISKILRKGSDPSDDNLCLDFPDIRRCWVIPFSLASPGFFFFSASHSRAS